MHVATLFKAADFVIDIDGVSAVTADLFPDWTAQDRFGLVIDEALGGLGATNLVQLAMAAFYDVKPSRRLELAVYPEIFAFHVGKGHGSFAPYDFWPARREVILSTDPKDVLGAINDRGITRLAVPNRPERSVMHRPKEEDCALDRIHSAFVYDASGRVDGGDVVIHGTDRKTEHNANVVLRAAACGAEAVPILSKSASRPLKEVDGEYRAWLELRSGDLQPSDIELAKDRRERLKVNGHAEEHYRRVSVREALSRLASAGMNTNDPIRREI